MREDSSKNENLKLSIGYEVEYTNVGGWTLRSFRILRTFIGSIFIDQSVKTAVGLNVSYDLVCTCI